MRQLFGSATSLLIGACCLGVAPVLAALTGLGLGFLINDAVLMPLAALALGFTLWALARSRRQHGNRKPLLLGMALAIMAFAGMWLWVPLAWLGFLGLLVVSVWDMLLVRRHCEA